MKKLFLVFIGALALIGNLLSSVQAERKPWRRRPGVVLYKLKAEAVAARHSAEARIYRALAGQDEEEAAAELMKTGTVAYAEPDYLMPVAAVPNDPGYPSQWYHTAIHSQAAWDITTGAGSVVVAVCDTGVDASHPDLAANISLPGYNSADGTTNTTPVFEHGTAVTGIMDALGNNATGGAGIAWNAKVLPVRVSNNSDGSAWCSDMAAGIEWASDHGAKVINLSYDITGCPNTIDSAAQYAQAKGAVTFVAAGNGSLNLSGTSFPTAHALVLVGATDSSGRRASFSNYGQPMDLAAPGVSIYAPLPGNTYAYGSGTSFAAPMAAGAAALLFSMSPAWTPDQIQQLLLATAEPAGTMNGYGILDAAAALNAAKTVLAGGPMPTLPGTPGAGASQSLADLNSMLVYPNPWRADRHGAGVPVIFDSLTADSTVKIFTMSGYEVRSLAPTSGKASWDLKNDSGETVASGIYLYSVTDSRGNKSQGKLAVIR
jgi:subtilisin family serine protease